MELQTGLVNRIGGEKENADHALTILSVGGDVKREIGAVGRWDSRTVRRSDGGTVRPSD